MPTNHRDLKRALTDAALGLVAEKGPKGFTLTEAASSLRDQVTRSGR
jgi:hypothetical protein